MKQKINEGVFIALAIISLWGILETRWLRNSPDYLLSFEISLATLIIMAAAHLILANRLKNGRETVVSDFKDEIRRLPTTALKAASEEMIFRGMITYLIAYAAGPSYGIVFGTLLFALVHKESDHFTIVYSIAMGLGLGFCVVYARDLFFPILAHIIFNVLGGSIKTINKKEKDVIIK